MPRKSHPQHANKPHTSDQGFAWDNIMRNKFARIGKRLQDHDITNPDQVIQRTYRELTHIQGFDSRTQKLVRYAIKTKHTEAIATLFNISVTTRSEPQIVDVLETMPESQTQAIAKPTVTREDVVHAAKRIVELSEAMKPIDADIAEAEAMLAELRAKRDDLEVQLSYAIYTIQNTATHNA